MKIFPRNDFQNTADDSRNVLLHFMFPNPDDLPSISSQLRRNPSIARDVAVQLIAPEFVVRFRLHTMLGASMPKAAVNENDQSPSSKCDVRPAGQLCMQSVSEAKRP
ncbi:MAG: hypothetical protein BGP08_01335 [Rhizobiales bacterium 64-17]|nr:MAG: hypothetical protein BGP08_01335 [Rhizobiales bacterium 64-17]